MRTPTRFGRNCKRLVSAARGRGLSPGPCDELSHPGPGGSAGLCARLALLVLLLGAVSACALLPAPPSTGAGIGGPSREELAARLKERADYWNSYQASLRIRAESSKAKNRFQAVVVARPPEMLRLEDSNPFGQVVAALILAPGRASLWTPSEKTLFTASDAQTLMKYFLVGSVPPDLFEYALAACIPPDLLDDRLRVASTATGWMAYNRDSRKNLDFTLGLSLDPISLRSITVKGDREDYSIQYDPPARLDRVSNTPEKVVFSSSEWRMEITVQRMEKSPVVQESVFTAPSPPEGARVLDVDGIR